MDFKKVFAVLIVALFLLSSISSAYAEDSSEDMSYDVVQTDDYSSSGSGVVQSEGYKLNSFVKNLYVYGDFIKCVVDLEDYSQVAKGATATPLPKEELRSVKVERGATATPLERGVKPLSWGEIILKKKLSDEKNLYEKNFKNIISNFKKVPYLQNHNFWNHVNFKYDSFKKNMDKANEYLRYNDLDLASMYIDNAKTDYIDMTVHIVKYHKDYYSALDRLNKVEEEHKKVCSKPRVKAKLWKSGKWLKRYQDTINKAKRYINNGDWDNAHAHLNAARKFTSFVLKRSK